MVGGGVCVCCVVLCCVVCSTCARWCSGKLRLTNPPISVLPVSVSGHPMHARCETQDERTERLPIYGFLEKVYMERILRR